MALPQHQIQRRRRPQAGPSSETITSNEGANSLSRQSSSSLLGPAPRHPLRTTDASQDGLARGGRSPPHSFLRSSARVASSFTGQNGQDYDEHDRRKLSAIDKLEGWFGLSNNNNNTAGEASWSHYSTARGTGPHSSPRKNTTALDSSISQSDKGKSKATCLVLVHTISQGDSLEALALRYNVNVRVLRRVNGLWPGDSVQTRSEIYIPIDRDTGAAAHAHDDARAASEDAGGRLTLLNSRNAVIPHDPVHARATSVASASSAASSRAMPSPTLRVIASDALSYFPPPSSLNGTRSGKSIDSARDSAKQTFGLAEGLQLDTTVGPGESGIEDLLQLAERAKMRGSVDEPDEGGTSMSRVPSGMSEDRSQLAPSDSVSAISTSPERGSRGTEELWKPNKWTFGERKRAEAAKQKEGASLASAASSALSSGAQEGNESRPAMMATGPTSASTYQGWNDIPEPPLSVSSKGKVAHAYKPKRKYPRPGGGTALDIPGAALLDDLVAGLPPNSGPAANWARPIADSLPARADAKIGEVAAQGHGSDIPAGKGRNGPNPGTTSSAGWGQMFSDTVRGKMRLEDALERGFEDLRQGLASVTAAPGEAALPQGGQGGLPPPPKGPPRGPPRRLDTNGASAPPQAQPSQPPSAPRRQSNKSLHELVDLGRTSEDDEGARVESHETLGVNAKSASNDDSKDGGSGMRGRRNARNVDWLS